MIKPGTAPVSTTVKSRSGGGEGQELSIPDILYNISDSVPHIVNLFSQRAVAFFGASIAYRYESTIKKCQPLIVAQSPYEYVAGRHRWLTNCTEPHNWYGSWRGCDGVATYDETGHTVIDFGRGYYLDRTASDELDYATDPPSEVNGYLLPSPIVDWECTWWDSEAFWEGRPYGFYPSRRDKELATSAPTWPEESCCVGYVPYYWRIHEKYAYIFGIMTSDAPPVGHCSTGDYDKNVCDVSATGHNRPTDAEASDVIRCSILVTSNDPHKNYCFSIDEGGLFEYNQHRKDAGMNAIEGLKGFTDQIYLQQFDDRGSEGSQGCLLFYKLIKDIFDTYTALGQMAHHHKDIELKEAHLFVDGIDYYEDAVLALRTLYSSELEDEERTDNQVLGFLTMM